MSNSATEPMAETIFAFTLIVVFGLKAVAIANVAQMGINAIAMAGNDDIMRLLSVRDWLNGQSWFDMWQYRILPPEGLDLHWSRYVDLGIAVVIWPFSLVLPIERAEIFGLSLWPALLYCTLVATTGLCAKKMFGPLVGAISMLAILWWPLTERLFSFASLDHHNVQLVLATFLVLSLIMPGSAAKRGVFGGLAAATSLAVGLEMLPAIAVSGVYLIVRAISLRPDGLHHLLAFCLAVTIGGAALFAGQVPFSEWGTAHCDELSVSYLVVAAAGTVVCGIYALFAKRLKNLVTRIAVFVALITAAAVLLFPDMQHCAAGPYRLLPKEVQDIIYGRIMEARPAQFYIFSKKAPDVLAAIIPAFLITLTMSGVWVFRVQTRSNDREKTSRIGVLLLFAWLGVIASLSQYRFLALAAPAIPLLIGLAFSELLAAHREQNRKLAVSILCPLLALILAPAMEAVGYGAELEENYLPDGKVGTRTCRDPDLLRELASLPPGRVLSSTNISVPLLLLTPHDVLTGPYHRSPDAFRDGMLPFEKDEDALREAIRRTRADYLFLCANGLYMNSLTFGTHLAATGEAEGLRRIDGLDDRIMVFEIVKN